MAEFTQGFNRSEINALVAELEAQAQILASKTDILEGIEDQVFITWKGPDADKYLENLFKYYEELVEAVNECFKGIYETIDKVEQAWLDFQKSGAA